MKIQCVKKALFIRLCSALLDNDLWRSVRSYAHLYSQYGNKITIGTTKMDAGTLRDTVNTVGLKMYLSESL